MSFVVWFEQGIKPEDPIVEEARLEFIKLFQERSKRFTFQLERGNESQKLHFQGRVSWKAKVRPHNAPQVPGWHAMYAIEADFGASEFYAMKEETKVQGPWTDKNSRQRYVQMAHRRGLELRPWQAQVLAEAERQFREYDNRKIICVVDPEGNSGKSFLLMEMKLKLNALLVPSVMKTGQDMVRCVMNQVVEGEHRYICVDAPRAMSEKHWWTIAQGLETIKNGMLFDDRYQFKEVIIESPVVILFCNSEPPPDVFSTDRWLVMNI